MFFLKKKKKPKRPHFILFSNDRSTFLQLAIVGFMIFELVENHINVCVHEMGICLGILFVLMIMMIIQYFIVKFLIHNLEGVRHTSSMKIG